MPRKTVTVVTVTYGDRWKFLSQVVDAVIRDDHVYSFIIVDNGSQHHEELLKLQEVYKDRVVVIRSEKNTGSAGGFARGIERARTTDTDFVLLLDDDTVLEPGGIDMFLATYESLEGKKVLCGWRPDIQSGDVFLERDQISNTTKTFFNIFSFSKIWKLSIKKFLKQPTKKLARRSVIQKHAFVYAGAFLPMSAIKEAPLPDKDLVLYGDDVEYSWGVVDAGYTPYLCDRPILRDVDMTFEQGDHIAGLFKTTTRPFKVYYRIRNMVRLSVRHSSQPKVVLFINIIAWVGALFVLGLYKQGPTVHYFKRVWLIIKAVYGGLQNKAPIPAEAVLP